MRLRIKKLNNEAIMPSYAHIGDAGMDLCSCEDTCIKPGEYKAISTGIAIALPSNMEAQVRPRSGIAFKYGVTILNSPGTIDEGYRGEIKVLLINHGKNDFCITKGMRIAQLVICSYIHAEPEFVESLDNTDRGVGGFGSTGL